MTLGGGEREIERGKEKRKKGREITKEMMRKIYE
jgi:hypothetical protein